MFFGLVDAVNAASQIEQLSEKIIPRCEGKHLIVVFNKTDLIEDKQKEECIIFIKRLPQRIYGIYFHLGQTTEEYK